MAHIFVVPPLLRHAAENALMTDPASIPHERRRALALLYGKYWAQ